MDNKILRQEVIAMALKIKWIIIPTNTPCKKYFADATKNDWVCRAVELAADNGIITRSNKYANPGKYVTRAEALAMMMKAGWIEIQNIPMQHDFTSPYLIDFMYTYDEYGGWQANVFYTYAVMGGWKSSEDSYKRCNSAPCKIDLRFNSYATRAEVFGFTRSIIESKKNTCASVGEYMISDDYGDFPPYHSTKCCSNLTVWDSGMDTSISIGNTCYETWLMAGALVNTCLSCGDNICSNIETPCNCPQDCKNGENADYASITDFCESNGRSESYFNRQNFLDNWGCSGLSDDIPLCHLCQ